MWNHLHTWDFQTASCRTQMRPIKLIKRQHERSFGLYDQDCIHFWSEYNKTTNYGGNEMDYSLFHLLKWTGDICACLARKEILVIHQYSSYRQQGGRGFRLCVCCSVILSQGFWVNKQSLQSTGINKTGRKKKEVQPVPKVCTSYNSIK